jgi:Acyltransferase family
MSERLKNIRFLELDILKSVAIIFIILAHSVFLDNPELSPNIFFLNQVRNFEVVMLVWISSGLAFASLYKKEVSFLAYFSKRVLRLVFPVWIFYLFFYLFFNYYYINFSLNQFSEIFPDFIIGVLSFGILGYWDYIWVIRVFLLTSILVYLFYKLIQRFHLNLILALQTILFLIFNYLYFFQKESLSFILENPGLRTLGIETLSYGLVIIHGYILYKSLVNKTFKNLVSIFLLGLFYFLIFLGFNYLKFGQINLEIIQENKYPPVFFYILYGLAISLMLYSCITLILQKSLALIKIIKQKFDFKKDNLLIKVFDKIFYFLANVFSWISNSTLLIYLWHIFSITLLSDSFFQEKITWFLPNWEFEKWDELFINYLIFAFIMAFLQRLVLFLLLKIPNLPKPLVYVFQVFRF